LWNNIFYSAGNARLLDIAPGQVGLQVQANCYFAPNGFSILWNGASYSSLDAWRNATGQEMIGGAKAGFSLDPKLASAGNGGTFNNADLLGNLSAYKLQSGSPL